MVKQEINKNVDIINLRTNWVDDSYIFQDNLSHDLLAHSPDSPIRYKDCHYYHLYLISKEDIFCEDFVYNSIKKIVFQTDRDLDGYGKHLYKVEATTDINLGAPLIPNSFIQPYINELPKTTSIIYQEYDSDFIENGIEEIYFKPKLEDNYIIFA